MFLTELLERQKDNEKVAIKYGSNEISFKEWYSYSRLLSCQLNEVTTNISSNIAIFLPNSINYTLAYFSILFSNKIIIPIGTQSKGLEIASILEYCEVDVIITSLQYNDLLRKYLSFYKYKVNLLFIEDLTIEIIHSEKEYILKSNTINNARNENDVAIMLHTSGTTSKPKRVMLTHNNLINNVESNIQSLKLTENDKVLIVMPMYFGYCNTAQFLTHLYLGASVVILDKIFTPSNFFKIVQREKITNFTAVPTMLLLLLEYKGFENYDYSSLKYICFGGGPMPTNKLKELILKYKSIGFIQTYGQTEASPRVTALMPIDSLNKIGSVGKSIPNVKVKIVNEQEIEVEENEVGEIIVNGKNIMKGYFKNEKITSETIKNNWLYTGDLGYKDKDGYLYITGRMKNIIISGGLNIYPEEIEEILLNHLDIKEVYVTGESHNLLGEVPVAKIVTSNSAVDVKNIRYHCINYLSTYKIPIRFDIVKEIDKTYNGKIKRY